VSDELEILRIVSERLAQAGISYMLTGSVAMAWYAQPRQTRDIDLVVELPESRVADFVQAFAADFYVDADVARDEVRRLGMFNMIQEAFVVKVDVILRKGDPYSREAFGRRRTIEIVPGTHVSIISAEDLVLAKLAWAAAGESDLQLRDVRNLLSSVTDLDHAYLSHWAPSLGLAELLQKVSSP
jgi:hypothetical protein